MLYLFVQVVSSVERKDEEGVTFFDVKLLHTILMNELNNLQGSSMTGQRKTIVEVTYSWLHLISILFKQSEY